MSLNKSWIVNGKLGPFDASSSVRDDSVKSSPTSKQLIRSLRAQRDRKRFKSLGSPLGNTMRVNDDSSNEKFWPSHDATIESNRWYR